MINSRNFVLYVVASCIWFVFGYDALTTPNTHVYPPKMQSPIVAYTYFGIGILMLTIVMIIYYRKKKQQEKK
jgi:hypothetical protein